MNKSETQKYACELREEIARLEENVGYYKDSISRVEKNCDKLYHENKELKQITKGYEDKIAKLEKTVECYKQALIYKCSNFDSQSKILEKFATENESLKQRIAELESKNNQLTESILRKETKIHELESKETETCEKEPKVSDSALSIEWYENRHQSDCIEINRLNTTIDVLIHKIEYLRQFAGLE